MKKAIIMMGIQASGKSSFCKGQLSEGYVRISLDELNTRNKEKLQFYECVENGKGIVIDNTNPTKEDRQRYIPTLKDAGYVIAGYFMQSRVADCVARNEKREGKEKVPRAAIAATSNKLELPDYSEGFDELYYVQIADNGFKIDKWDEENEV